ncbi:GNAT family N-acetyltransferase [Clostridium sp. UBA6640]|uniref:GNAT family N-acetyltransferase n=1 Tax=Clostridium sp. UBA6640 TaxID=1946370 RepID=UPI0025C516B1|nr:GNAT family protein [Clostridium sp. UBA6640]
MGICKLEMINFLELRGNLVYLKKLGSEYLEEYCECFKNASIESNVFTGTKEFYTKSNLESFLNAIENDSNRVDFLIFSKDSNEIVGEVVISEVSVKDRSANIRIGINKKEDFNKGYGSEAMILALNYGFGMFNLHRIELNVFEFNKRAINVYEKLGFVKEGIKRDSLYFNHKYHNEIIMSILEEEFKQLYTNYDEDLKSLL